MADKKLRFDIEANSDEARRALAELRRAFDATLGALKKQQGDVALFKAAQQDAAKLEAQIRSLAKAGGDSGALTATLNECGGFLFEMLGDWLTCWRFCFYCSF